MSKVTQRERLSSILAFLSSRNRLKTRTSFRKQNTRSFSARQPKEGPAVVALSTTPKATFEGFVSFLSYTLHMRHSLIIFQCKGKSTATQLDFSINLGQIIAHHRAIGHDLRFSIIR
jgi:hypothetical protein